MNWNGHAATLADAILFAEPTENDFAMLAVSFHKACHDLHHIQILIVRQ